MEAPFNASIVRRHGRRKRGRTDRSVAGSGGVRIGATGNACDGEIVMTRQGVSVSHSENTAQDHRASRNLGAAPFLVRLDGVPATDENRHRISERIRRLDRALQESGMPFQLRLL